MKNKESLCFFVPWWEKELRMKNLCALVPFPKCRDMMWEKELRIENEESLCFSVFPEGSVRDVAKNNRSNSK
jgi:hypothetical protein